MASKKKIAQLRDKARAFRTARRAQGRYPVQAPAQIQAPKPVPRRTGEALEG